MSGWMSKSTGQTAHYVEADGAAACARMGRAPFTATFVAFNEHDHLCRECKRKYPRECRCGRCRVDAHLRARKAAASATTTTASPTPWRCSIKARGQRCAVTLSGERCRCLAHSMRRICGHCMRRLSPDWQEALRHAWGRESFGTYLSVETDAIREVSS